MVLALQLEEVFKEKAIFKGNQHFAPLSIIDNEPKHNTQKIVAENFGKGTQISANPIEIKPIETQKEKTLVMVLAD